MSSTGRPQIAISITEGRTVRDLFYNGLLKILVASGYDVMVFTEAITVDEFIKEWKSEHVEFSQLFMAQSSKSKSRSLRLRRFLARNKLQWLLKIWLGLEQKRIYPARQCYLDYFEKYQPVLLLTTHAHLPAEAELISSAHQRGIPTAGIVRSWDNVFKGIQSRPQHIMVWNQINKEELIRYEGYSESNIHMVGAPQFDPYFVKENMLSKNSFCEHWQLDPGKPIILFATLGYFFPGFDETCWMDVLLQLIHEGELPADTQIICRLHPWSRYEHFQRYKQHPNIRLSFVDKYWPALTWYMNQEDMKQMANILAHSDVVITPASTVTLEAAIFDKPTIIPMFHPYQPDRAKKYFAKWVLGKHFGRIAEHKLVPILEDAREFGPAINRALSEPSWCSSQRSKLVEDYVNFTDGLSTQRVVDVAISLAQNSK